MAVNSKLFLVDEKNDQCVQYSDLLKPYNSGRVIYKPYIYANDIFEIFVQIINSIILDKEITVLDSDFTENELKQLLDDISVLNIQEECKLNTNIANFPGLREKIINNEKWKINLFTSGTTGKPKKVTHDFKSITRQVKTGKRHSSDIWGFAYNPTHIAGIQVFFQALLNQNAIVNLFNYPREEILSLLDKYGITHISATPSFYRLLLPIENPRKSVRRITSGGEKFDNTMQEQIKEGFPNAKILNVYASTEAGTLFASDNEVFEVKEQFYNLVKVEDNELLIHKSLVGLSDYLTIEDNWYPTGDMVEVINQNPLRVKFIQRKSAIINIGGYNVNPIEIEDILREHEFVEDVVVYSKNNSVLGNILHCDVKTSGKVSEEILKQYLNGKLQKFKVPRFFNFVEEIPRTRTGKIQR